MDSVELRRSFLDYFGKHGHEIVRSSPLVPANDPTLLFTNAGMVQFKDVFTGRETRAYERATTSQKCVRAGGKHNDLENVGRTARHHTFFEMLGNFSFGDYFKEGAITFAWEWLTKTLGLDPAHLVITVFKGETQGVNDFGPDDEARAIWKKVTGFSDERIIGLGLKDNFWQMGDLGPCGPCSEIHYFVGDDVDLGKFNQEPDASGVGWMEIWNLVFMQYERYFDDRRTEHPIRQRALPKQRALPRPSIDTGAGLERVAAVTQGVRSNYDTDLFKPLIAYAAQLAKKKYAADGSDDAVSMRVLADHARASTFLIADGVMPSNEGRGYVLRRIMRRAIRHGVRLGIGEGGFSTLCNNVVDNMSGPYPELEDAKSLILRAVDAEDQAFRRTLDRGLKLLDEAFGTLGKGATLPGETVFKLYDTYGFPADLTRVIAEERGFSVDESGFDREMDKQRARGEFGGSGEAAVSDQTKALEARFGATEFLGYETTHLDDARLLGATPDGGVLITDRTPFYGESGGQVGDTGVIEGAGFRFLVSDTQKAANGLVLHHGKLEHGALPAPPAKVSLRVDEDARDRTRANHSATHLLHQALKQVLGAHVAQKGSLVGPDRLRFDFSHFQPMTDAEKREVEDRVNAEIRKNVDTRTELMSFDEAKQAGAVALFGEKYGERVRVLHIGRESVELCGGTHVRRAGDIGLFVITQELGIAQGVRRIEAQTGAGALAFLRRLEHELDASAQKLKSQPFEVAAKIERMADEVKSLRKDLDEARRKMAMGGGSGGDLMSQVREVGGVKILSAKTDVADPKALREVADQLRGKLGSGLVVLGGIQDGKVSLVAAVTSDLTNRLHAGKIIGELAKIVGGKGGGRPDFAQAGGPDAARLDEALAKVFELGACGPN